MPEVFLLWNMSTRKPQSRHRCGEAGGCSHFVRWSLSAGRGVLKALRLLTRPVHVVGPPKTGCAELGLAEYLKHSSDSIFVRNTDEHAVGLMTQLLPERSVFCCGAWLRLHKTVPMVPNGIIASGCCSILSGEAGRVEKALGLGANFVLRAS